MYIYIFIQTYKCIYVYICVYTGGSETWRETNRTNACFLACGHLHDEVDLFFLWEDRSARAASANSTRSFAITSLVLGFGLEGKNRIKLFMVYC